MVKDVYQALTTPTKSNTAQLHRGKGTQLLILFSDYLAVASRTTETLEGKSTRRTRIESEFGVEVDDRLADDDMGALTASQQHDLRIAEIQLRREELELQRQEKKNIANIQRAQIDSEACRQREKHEMMLQLMAFITGGAG